ncbi:DUF4062 domain-containing protein [Paraburkholderia fungorum]|uniref:DUF4062 domain-containing protein n=1 Tax=Paraburkholderia fungorum TaxID=134537 RepID=UPI002091F359|nr:DUF4062 domain-containing protein [Paraburkholderia fungorum]USU14206.1 DUF4062 domain-containing protein [Paraburkholderia fungorum]USU22154.1 DUF4062 domain-containing protein [Paraburkholderia fungorum]
MQALLELECIPAGMELFPAANDSQWDWIKKVIDESDYYIVIIGGRYGSVSKESGLSYTEMEYRYAVETGKPVIGFLVEDASQLPHKLVEQQPGKVKKLEAFRDLVKNRLCKFYNSPVDLGAKVSRSLTQLRKQYPRSGWVRADVLAALPSPDELLRLKSENEDLRRRLESYGLEGPKSREFLASGSDTYQIDFVFTRSEKFEATGGFRSKGSQWEKIGMSWDDIFALLGPSILRNNNSYWNAAQPLASRIEYLSGAVLTEAYPNSKFSNFRISSDCIDTILLQLRALKLIELDDDKSWQLTAYGDNYLVSLLGVPKSTNP